MLENNSCNSDALEKNIYQVKIGGKVSSQWISWFSDMKIEIRKDNNSKLLTVLTGAIKDQTALFGLLKHIGSLGLTLISVQRL